MPRKRTISPPHVPAPRGMPRSKGETKKPARTYSFRDTTIHIEMLERLMIQRLLTESQCKKTLVAMAARNEVPHISEQRVAILYKRLEKEWADISKIRREYDWEKKVRELEEVIRLCRNGVKDDAGKWITRPSRSEEIRARAELHRVLGMYAPQPLVVMTNTTANVQSIDQRFAALPRAGLSQMLLGLPYMGGDDELIDVEAEVLNGGH